MIKSFPLHKIYYIISLLKAHETLLLILDVSYMEVAILKRDGCLGGNHISWLRFIFKRKLILWNKGTAPGHGHIVW